jgi:TRAP-type mannitol/chloroaromatic compound transport system permease small subunit
VYGLIPLGFALLMLQGASELIKRAAFLTGVGPDALDHSGPSEAELLAKDIAEQEKARQAGASA